MEEKREEKINTNISHYHWHLVSWYMISNFKTTMFRYKISCRLQSAKINGDMLCTCCIMSYYTMSCALPQIHEYCYCTTVKQPKWTLIQEWRHCLNKTATNRAGPIIYNSLSSSSSVINHVCLLHICSRHFNSSCYTALLICLRKFNLFLLLGNMFLTLNGHTKTAEQCTIIQQWWLVHWPLMDGLQHLVQRGGSWAGCGPANARPRCTKCNSLHINGQCTNLVLFDVVPIIEG